MTQAQQVIEAMRSLGGVATLGKLNQSIDFSNWKTKTPQASVRRIVQIDNAFFRIEPGLWALDECKDEVLTRFKLQSDDANSVEMFTHSYYQGLVLEIGNLRKMETFIPNQDKNKLYLGNPLKDIANMPDMYPFTYNELTKYAKTVDVVWFNERKMPHSFFEIEHTTDMKNSLSKFFELQDFNAEFFIIAPDYRRAKFDEDMARSMFKDIQKRVKFIGYEKLAETHSAEYRQQRYF